MQNRQKSNAKKKTMTEKTSFQQLLVHGNCFDELHIVLHLCFITEWVLSIPCRVKGILFTVKTSFGSQWEGKFWCRNLQMCSRSVSLCRTIATTNPPPSMISTSQLCTQLAFIVIWNSMHEVNNVLSTKFSNNGTLYSLFSTHSKMHNIRWQYTNGLLASLVWSSKTYTASKGNTQMSFTIGITSVFVVL